MKLLKRIIMMVVVAACVGCGGDADAQTGPVLAKDLTLTTAETFVLCQNHLASTTKKTAYVLALDDDIQVTAWRFVDSVWTLVLPNYIPSDPAIARSDSVMICPQGFTLPVIGQFDALTLKGLVSGGAVQVHVYK